MDLLDASNTSIRSIKDVLKALFGLVLHHSIVPPLSSWALCRLPLFVLVAKDGWRM
ncbi:hypothetical protein MUK42_35436 [Musa troglodytarum]|uniref:Uncharacterized protein n=1 Tax=Musa troglodytarum TaxID=320322 RepID=A0A9E7KZ23_9LILI|nr:hypothetical protein MUK42_35436 [Musa troglodytarum]